MSIFTALPVLRGTMMTWSGKKGGKNRLKTQSKVVTKRGKREKVLLPRFPVLQGNKKQTVRGRQ